MSIDHSRPRVKLFPYQARGTSKIWGQFESGIRSTLAVFATGTGKTVLGGDVARDTIEHFGGAVLWLAHRDLLVRQAVEDLAFVGVEAAVEKAEEYARANPLYGDPQCVVASVQTLKGKRLASWPRDYFKLVITDECHHAVGGSYQAIYDHFRWDWHLGLTATPDRLDGENLGQVYQTVADEYSLMDAVQDGFLKRPRIKQITTDIDLSQLSTKGKADFSDADLEEVMRPHIESLANLTRQHIESRRSFVFTPGVRSAEAYASALSSLGVPSHAISGDTPNRDEIWEDFRQGRVRCVCNCDLATEGANFPFVSAVVLARKTKSRAKLSQMVGRGTRKYPGQDHCLVVDFAMLTGQHKLAQPTDLLDTTRTHAETIDIATDLIATGETDDLMHAIQRAETIRQERQKLRIVARERKVKHRCVTYDAFSVMDSLNLPVREESETSLRYLATDRQVETLGKLGVKVEGDISRRRASMILDNLFDRMDKGLATHKQVSWLIAMNVDPAEARTMTKEQATDRLNQLWGKRSAG